MTASHSTDIVVFGGGIAGLWLLNRLRDEGYNAILLEADGLGAAQTLASHTGQGLPRPLRPHLRARQLTRLGLAYRQALQLVRVVL